MEIIYISLHSHHQNDSWIKMGSDESHFNVSVTARDKVTKTVSTDHNLSEEKGEPKPRYRTEVLPLTSLTPYRQAKPAHRSKHLWWSLCTFAFTRMPGEIYRRRLGSLLVVFA